MTAFPVGILILLVFMNRYLGGMFWKRLRGKDFDPTIQGFEPTVTAVIPLYNEGEGIFHTVVSLLEQDYPPDKLRITVVDDCSGDDSYAWACKAAQRSPDRVTVIKNPFNMGKRLGIINAVRQARSEIILSVDSDVVVDRLAVKKLMSRFVRPEIVAVGGRVCPSNANENWLTRMQAIKYFLGYEFIKNIERAFRTVMCLSGCLTAYRRRVLIELEPVLENRNMLGVPIKYGEDRFLTRQIVKAGYQTCLTMDALCWTIAPPKLSKYLSQQLRWRRSNLIDFMCGITHVWQLHPVVCLHYLSQYSLLVAYPLVIVEMVISGTFWELAFMHAGLLIVFGAAYWRGSRDIPAAARVHPLWFVTLAVIMPVTYLLYTPLALFTLDSSSWETRGRPTPASGAPREQGAS